MLVRERACELTVERSSAANAADERQRGGGVSADRIWAIVLAGGVARRFGERPKQFEPVGGVRMVDRTVAAARRTCHGVVVVLPPGRAWDGEPVDAVAEGGDHQSESLRAGLAAVPRDVDVVVVCDPAHPLAGDHLFTAVVEAVGTGADGAVPVLPILEVVQRVEHGRVVATLPKTTSCSPSPPGVPRGGAARGARRPAPPVENSGLLVERGHRVDTVPGDPANLHVTTPAELAVLDRLATEGQPA
jgi:2-C-methyl-D-erythritol 4-phosphate cytidylyltransferase